MPGVAMGAARIWVPLLTVTFLLISRITPSVAAKPGRTLLSADWYPENYTSPYRPPDSDREVTVLSGPWKFHRGHVQESHPYDRYFDDSNWESVSVPHTWNAKDGQDGGDNYYRGLGWYRVKIHISEEYKGLERKFFLQFEGAMLVTYLWVNGHYIGVHKGGFATFRIDVTAQLELRQENSVAVLVNNAYNKDVMPLWPADFTFFGGLYRNVSLLVTNTLHVTATDYGGHGIKISQSNVTRKAAKVEMDIKVDNLIMAEKMARLTIIIVDAESRVVQSVAAYHKVPANSTRIEFVYKTMIRNPRLWHGVKDPHLYRVYVEIRYQDSIVDVFWQPLGLRSFHVDSKVGFVLNGEPYDLHGVTRHQDRYDKGWALSAADHGEDLDLIEEIGATAVRLTHYQHDQRFLDLCDARGIIVWAELPLIKLSTNTKAFFKNAKEQQMELIRQNYNHPSIVFWGIGNEQDSTDGASDALLWILANKAQAEDRSRLSTYAHSGETGYLDPLSRHTDLVALNKYLGWYGGYHDEFGPWIDILHAKYPDVKLAVSEYGAGANIFQHVEVPERRPKHDGDFHPEEWQALVHESHWLAIKRRPFLWAKFVMTMFDFAADWRSEGGTPGMNDKGLVTYDHKTRKDAFYWYKANWNDWDPFVYITSRRFDVRTNETVRVKVYSNLVKVELKCNGVSWGVKESADRMFVWPAVRLSDGRNTLTVQAETEKEIVVDEVVWTLRAQEGTG